MEFLVELQAAANLPASQKSEHLRLLRGGAPSRLVRCAGASVGALVAVCVALGVSPDVMRRGLRRLAGSRDHVPRPDPDGSSSAPRIPASYLTEALREFIAHVLRTSGADPLLLTLGEVERARGIEICILATAAGGCASEARVGRVVMLSSRKHGSMLAADALWASMAIPGLIDPLIYHGVALVDGCYGATRPVEGLPACPQLCACGRGSHVCTAQAEDERGRGEEGGGGEDCRPHHVVVHLGGTEPCEDRGESATGGRRSCIRRTDVVIDMHTDRGGAVGVIETTDASWVTTSAGQALLGERGANAARVLSRTLWG